MWQNTEGSISGTLISSNNLLFVFPEESQGQMRSFQGVQSKVLWKHKPTKWVIRDSDSSSSLHLYSHLTQITDSYCLYWSELTTGEGWIIDKSKNLPPGSGPLSSQQSSTMPRILQLLSRPGFPSHIFFKLNLQFDISYASNFSRFLKS